jgi:N,N'-diacetyllegionaminate synthase
MSKTFVIAEIGINHNGSLKVAKKLVDSAVRAGVDAVKFQTYITEKRVKKNSPIFNILKKCELSFEDFRKLNDYSKSKGVEFMSTPFDLESFNFLKSLKISKIKIASFDTVNTKFLKEISKKKSNFIMSVGMSKIREIESAYKILRNGSKNKVSLLHCVSSYPTEEKDSQLNCIKYLKKKFDCSIGHSDHTNDIFVPFCAVAMGASIIEKHFMIDNKMKCIDKPVSITENQMKTLILNIRRFETSLGKDFFGVRKNEKQTKIFRRFS